MPAEVKHEKESICSRLLRPQRSLLGGCQPSARPRKSTSRFTSSISQLSRQHLIPGCRLSHLRRHLVAKNSHNVNSLISLNSSNSRSLAQADHLKDSQSTLPSAMSPLTRTMKRSVSQSAVIPSHRVPPSARPLTGDSTQLPREIQRNLTANQLSPLGVTRDGTLEKIKEDLSLPRDPPVSQSKSPKLGTSPND